MACVKTRARAESWLVAFSTAPMSVAALHTRGAHVWPTVESFSMTEKFTTGDQRLTGLLRCITRTDYQYGVSLT